MTTPADQKQQQKNQWGGAAHDWEKWDSWFQEQTRDLTEWLCDQVALTPGMRVLDLACGVGQPALTAAMRVAPGGRVVATDIAPEMVAAAQQAAARAGRENIEFREADLEAIPYPDASFDAVTCRFGLMFCPDPVKGAAEIRRVLKPGGRFALAVWAEPQKNVQFTSFLGPLSQIAPGPAPDPNAPGLFRLAAPGELERILKEAGLTDFSIEARSEHWEYASAEAYWETMTELAAPLKAATATLSAETLARLKQAVIDGVQAHNRDGSVRLPTAPLCASGRV